MKIPLDINNPGCPRPVIYSIIADYIRAEYNQTKIEPHPLLVSFLDAHPEGLGYDWQMRVMDELKDKPISLIERWVNEGLPSGFFRAELRGYLSSLRNKVS